MFTFALKSVLSLELKHTTALFALSDYDILSQEWRVIVDQVQANYHGTSNYTIVSQVLIMRDPCYDRMCLSQLMPSGFSILSCEKGLRLRPRTFFTAKNGELLGLYPIHNLLCYSSFREYHIY